MNAQTRYANLKPNLNISLIGERIRTSRSVGSTVLIWSVPLLLALVILVFGVNVPFWDDWELVPIIQHVHAGHWYFRDFWQQHNEHRPFFPTIVLVLLALGSRWNEVLICLVSLAVAAGGFVMLRRVIVSTTAKDALPLTLLLLVSIIWFSPDQMENWLWGWQFEWFMNVFGTMLVVYGLTRAKRLLEWRQVMVIVAGVILAQFSLGNGTLLWPLTIVALLYLRASWRQTATVFIIGCAATFLYYFHYVNPAEPSKTLGLYHPLSLAAYIFVYLGRPLAPLYHPALLLGLMSLALYSLIAWRLIYWRRSELRQALPWLLLGAYAIASSLITGLARVGFGAQEALSSRYTTISNLLLVSLIMLVWQQRRFIKAWRLRGNMYLPITGVVLLYVLVGFNALWGVHTGIDQHRKLEAAKICTARLQPTNACLLQTYPDAVAVSPRVVFLKSVHYAGY